MPWVKIWFMTLAVLLLAGCPQAEEYIDYTYYVATTGDDANPGTSELPWKTIQKAVNTAQPGESVLVRGGIYSEKVNFTKSGTAGNRITFHSESKDVAIIDGTGVAVAKYDSLVEIRNVHYITLAGFEVRNSSYRNVHIGSNSTHIILQNLNVHHGAAEAEIFVDGCNNTPAFSVITGCKAHDGPKGGICIWECGAGYWLIENNEVYNNVGAGNWDGIQVEGNGTGTHHIILRNNKIHDNATWTGEGADNLDLTGNATNHHYLVEGNTLYGTEGSFKLHSGRNFKPGISSFHIARFNRLTGIPYTCYDFPNPIAMYNNTFVDGQQFVMFYGQGASGTKTLGDSTYTGGDAGRMNWKNNIFFQQNASASHALLASGASAVVINLGYESVRFQNNLYRLTANQRITWASLFMAPINAARFAEFQASCAPDYPDTGSILTSASVGQTFANYSNKDYHLVAGSPAIDKGIPLTVATSDGANSTTLTVDRSSYFFDGYPLDGEYLAIADSIRIGNNNPVAIVSIEDATNTITLSAPVTWKEGDPVTLPYNGSAPDMGAFEFK